MNEHVRRTSIVLTAVLVAACTAPADRAPGAAADVSAAASDSAAAGAEATRAGGDIVIRHSASADLTGDGRAERIVVSGTGPAYDSLQVRLEIRAPDGTLLHGARWPSWHYFSYGYPEDASPSSVESIVREHLQNLVADSAFERSGAGQRGRRSAVDTMAITDDVLEREWRMRNRVADTLPIPQGAEIWTVAAGRDPRVRARAAALARELSAMPRFTYYAGGEETYSIAWSASEQRFVRVFSCC